MKEKKTFTTANEVLTEVLGKAPAKSKSNAKDFDFSTPTRISHIQEIMTQLRAPLEVCVEALTKLNASGWLKKPAREVTAEDLEQLRKAEPWNHKKPSKAQRGEAFEVGLEYTGHLFK